MAPKRNPKPNSKPRGGEAIEEIKAIAFSNMGDYIEQGPDGRVRLRQETLADPVKMRAVEHLELKENGGFSIRLRDKLGALGELLTQARPAKFLSRTRMDI